MYSSTSAMSSTSGPMTIPRTISSTTVGSTSRWCSLDRSAPRLDAARTRTSELRSASATAARQATADGADAPLARERVAGLQPDQCLAAAERVRRAGHRLDGEAAPVDVGERVAGEDHQVAVGLVHPEREPRPPSGSSELDAREAVVVALEVGEAVVEPRRADRPAAAGSRTPCPRRTPRRPAGRARRTCSTRPPGRAQDHARRPSRSRRSGTDARRPRTGRLRSRRSSRSSAREARVGERVLDAEVERERVARLRVQHVLHHDPVRLPLADPPGGPAHEAVDRVRAPPARSARAGAGARRTRSCRPRSRFGHGSSAWPRPPCTSRRRRSRRAAPGRQRVRAQPAADLDDDRPLVAERELDLLAGRRAHLRRTSCSTPVRPGPPPPRRR